MLSEAQQKQDALLRESILAAFAADSQLAACHLRVGVLNGIAHLAGEVPSLEIWHRAENLAGQVAGVRGVVNRIQAPGAAPPSRPIDLKL